MPVIRLLIAYDGTDFHGWASQPSVRTVQATLETALGRMLGAPPRLSVAGRTDAGVHARGQVASFTALREVDPPAVQRAMNAMLAPEVVVVGARRAPDGFDARRSARSREYVYRIRTAAVPDPLSARYRWHHPARLSVPRMRSAAARLVGEHDFASFCRAPKLPMSTVRTLQELSVTADGASVAVRARADGFLHQMVRSLAGTLVRVGEGGMDPDAMGEVLAARSRAAAGPVAPPHGLTLVRVRYR